MNIDLETAMAHDQAAFARDDYPMAEGHFRKPLAGAAMTRS